MKTLVETSIEVPLANDTTSADALDPSKLENGDVVNTPELADKRKRQKNTPPEAELQAVQAATSDSDAEKLVSEENQPEDDSKIDVQEGEVVQATTEAADQVSPSQANVETDTAETGGPSEGDKVDDSPCVADSSLDSTAAPQSSEGIQA